MCIPEGARSPTDPALTEALRRHLGHSAFRPGQEILVAATLEGRDALGILPTGGGKSVCFQLPAFLLPGLVLVISPLISLMEDQVSRAAQAGLRVGVINTHTPPPTRRRLLREGREGRLKLLFISPERLQVHSFQEAVRDLPVSLVAVDEAHCISMWGRDFRPAYLKLGDIRSLTRAPVMALTATATPEVRIDIEKRLRLRDPVRVVGSFDRPNLFWRVRRAESFGRKLASLVELLRDRSGASIVYASTRKTVEAVRRSLAGLGQEALAYHAGLPADLRTWVQNRFLHDARPLVIATNAFGMGIDRPDVRLVAHVQLPGSLEAYYQEAGRAGRDGKPAHCVALHGKRDRGVHDRFLERSYPANWKIREVHRALLRRMGSDRAVAAPVSDLRTALGRRGTSSDVRTVLNALARCGAIVPEESPARGGAGGEEARPDPGRPWGGESTDPPLGREVRLWIRLRSPDLRNLQRARQSEMAKIDAVEAFVEARTCRRAMILGYFGETRAGRSCGGCDRCGLPPEQPGKRGRQRPPGLFAAGARR